MIQPMQSTSSDGTQHDMTPGELAATLRRALDAVESEKHNRWLEVARAVILALSTTCSAWCAYQSSRWGGVQAFRLAAAGKADRDSAQLALEAIHMRALDIQMALAYFEARNQGNDKSAEFLRERFRPEAKVAFDAWLETNPFDNPQAPKRPFEMPEYHQREMREAGSFEAEAIRMLDAARFANSTSDAYVLLTVLFASVLFFGGIGATFQSRRLRFFVVVIAAILFLGTVIALGTMPICHD